MYSGAAFAHPYRRVAGVVFRSDANPDVRVGPIELGDGALERDRLLGIRFRSEEMMRPDRRGETPAARRGTSSLGLFDHSVETPGQMQVGPMKLSPEHLRDVVFGLLGAIHFAHASHQADGAFAVSGHLLFGGDRSVTGNDGVEVELERRA
jgi:hypothetical protein